MDEGEAIDALTRLGLTTYEARAFIALQKLGTGTASDVSDLADVPRSQVYGAADGLEARGLVEVNQTSPTEYRPVSLAEAREKLLRELEADGERAFEYLQSVEGTHAGSGRRSEAVWTVGDADAITTRVADLVSGADERVIYGTSSAAHLDPPVVDALQERAAAGVTVIVSSEDPDVLTRVPEVDGIITGSPDEQAPGTGRVLVADRDGVLLSVVGGEHLPEGEGETAIWSADTAFAAIIVTLVEEWVETHHEFEDR
jgi:sugar-specific transcriptional regulator TrmB